MTPASIRDYLHTLRPRATTDYNRKSAIRALNAPERRSPSTRGRPRQYDTDVQALLAKIWEAAGFPWSVRLKALLPLWLPWATRHMKIPAPLARHLLTMSPSTMDRALRGRKRALRLHRYGRTKPGALLKHHIPLRTDRWTVTTPGFAEIDLVAHCGDVGDGTFVQSVNLTDIHSAWVETRAVLGKSQRAICQALDEMRAALPFPLRGLDSDNGSEFINDHLLRYCRLHQIQFTRGRPYKKDDNAHIEQKNWTHVRKLLGWLRYDSPQALEAINDLFRHELRLMMNLFQPAVKLQRKVRIGSRVTRVYEAPHTPLDRVLACNDVDPASVLALQRLRKDIDPFALAQTIERKLTQIYRLASRGPVVKQPIGRGFRIRSAWAQVPPKGAQAPVTPFMTR